MMKAAAKLYGGRNPIDVPAYTPAVAAHHLRLPIGNVRYWTLGRDRAQPVIRVADPAAKLLSFRNLVEVHVLSAVTRNYGVRLGAVRKAVRYLQDELAVEHPLTTERMETDGVSLFVRRYGELIDATASGQVAIEDLLHAHLERIRWDDKGLPVRLFPFTRGQVDGPAAVVIDPAVQFGRPCIKGSGVPTGVIVGRFRAGEELEALALDCNVKTSDIEEAIRYELGRQAA